MRTIPVVVAVSAAVILFTSCGKKDAATAVEQPKSVEPEARVHRGTNGVAIIKLDTATQKIMGLTVVPLVAVELAPEVKGFGRVVDPAPLAEMLIQFRKAQLAFDSSHQELERMKVLKKDNNASERAFQSAEATYLQNQTEVGAVMFNVERAFGRKVMELLGPMVVPPGTERKPNPVLGEIGEARNVFLVRVDLPASEPLNSEPTEARIVGLGDNARPIRADYFGDVLAIDPQTQTRGIFFLVSTNQPKLTPGIAVTAFIKTDGQAQYGVVVPSSAVVRYNGGAWIYQQTGDEEFTRHAISTNIPAETGWFVTHGLVAGAKVVTIGAQLILSEEVSAAGFSDGEHH